MENGDLSSNDQAQAASTNSLRHDDLARCVGAGLHVAGEVVDVDRLEMPWADHVGEALADNVVGFGRAQPAGPEVVDGGPLLHPSVSRHFPPTFTDNVSLP